VRRREFLRQAGVGLGAAALLLPIRAPRPVPTPAQLAWQRSELALFLHFGINTFTGREWGDGTEDPALFNPAGFDARQWARVAKGAGFKTLILTAKHHDGFCLWPTSTTSHSVRRSPWRSGTGDVVHETAIACRVEGLGFGVYLSPWDRNAPSYGDSPRYNSFYRDQLTELLTRYGPLVEVWFDGANGEGPNGKRQLYDWPAVHALVRRLQPGALMFSDAGPDIRWIGNRRGVGGNWCKSIQSVYRGGGPAVERCCNGDRTGRPGAPARSNQARMVRRADEDGRVKRASDLLDLYGNRSVAMRTCCSTSANAAAAPADVSSLVGRICAAGSRRQPGSGRGSRPCSLRAPRPVVCDTICCVRISCGGRWWHRVEMGVDGAWNTVATGTTIGRSRLHRIEPRTATAVRISVEVLGQPALLPPRLYLAP
jgi:alpha-L-fucosidase